MSDLRQRLSACFSSIFPDLSDKEIPLATMNSVDGWDSLATVTLIAVVEEEFGVQVSPDDLEQFASFELIVDYLQRRANDSVGSAQGELRH
jgi:acyl carrier protein